MIEFVEIKIKNEKKIQPKQYSFSVVWMAIQISFCIGYIVGGAIWYLL